MIINEGKKMYIKLSADEISELSTDGNVPMATVQMDCVPTAEEIGDVILTVTVEKIQKVSSLLKKVKEISIDEESEEEDNDWDHF